MKKIEIDFSKVLVSDYLEYLANITSPIALFELADKATIGGIKDRSVSELPAILAQFMKAFQEEIDNITIAVISMQRYLKNDDAV